jgi:antitoxin component of RelBE/YafQ-DinJ toxin-antitoxin module
MVDKSKISTISVRIEEELNQKMEAVTSIIGFNKSDFLRACIEKLISDNKMLLEHCDKFGDYINFIRHELSALPKDIIMVKNGSWSDVTDFLILMLCDQLWQMGIVRKNWKAFVEKYKVGKDFLERNISNKNEFFSLENLVFLSAEKSGIMPTEDIPSIIKNENWINNVEGDRISLVVAVKSSIENQTAFDLITDYLRQEKQKSGKTCHVVIDARGTFRRIGDWLYYPVTTEELPAEKGEEKKMED